MLVHDFLKKLQIPKKYLGLFPNIEMDELTYRRRQKRLYWTLKTSKILSFELYQQLQQAILDHFHVALHLSVQPENPQATHVLVSDYLLFFYDQLGVSNRLRSSSLVLEGDLLSIVMLTKEDVDTMRTYQFDLQERLSVVGFELMVDFVLYQQLDNEEPKAKISAKPLFGSSHQPSANNGRSRQRGEPVMVELKHLVEDMNNIKTKGELFKLNLRQLKSGTYIANFMIHSGDDAIECTKFYKTEADCLLKENTTYLVTGDYQYNSYARNHQLKTRDIEEIAPLFTIEDRDPIKRVELHAHSNFSEMDAVSSVESLIQQAYDFGHPGLAITDHMVVHAFPKAQRYVEKLLKKNPDKPFKMVYGLEMNMVEDQLDIVKRAPQGQLNDQVYCIFDLETTGLSCRSDHIIEFGAVKIANGTELERLQLYIKPPVSIPASITRLTKIDDHKVAKAPALQDAFLTIKNFIGDSVLVAHNAKFDMGFLNEAALTLGQQAFDNPVINTLDLARTIITDRTRFNLGTVARYYKIAYDQDVAHQADYDAEVLASVFRAMLNTLQLQGVRTFEQLVRLQEQTPAYDKLFKHHVVVLAKNELGLKQLYQLVSTSHSETLMFNASKAKDQDEVQAEPRIYRSKLNELREHLLIGSACFNSKLFDVAQTGSLEELEAEMAFYDYIELQPLDNYRPLLVMESILSEEDLTEILITIVQTAQKLNKLIVATGDVHYQMPHHKVFREVYINAQGIGGVRHPLYLFDEIKRSTVKSPDQHLRPTQEMLDGYPYLDPQITRLIVSDNSLKILDMIEPVFPIPDQLFTPKIEGSDELLIELCYDRAYQQYGKPLPEIVEKRLKRELDSIISNGYGIIYYASHLLVKKSIDNGYMVGSRGSIGSSLVATMTDITEVNPLPPHYFCADCHFSDFEIDPSVRSGYDLESRHCPNCQQPMQGDGQNIPFETFLGFEGDKVPDIDLNFSSQFQEHAHAHTKEIFGETKVLRAGTIGTVAEKTAFGYVSGYFENVPTAKGPHDAYKEYLAHGCQGVKRTTGQHPGGILVIPQDMDVFDFTPVQYPANNPNSQWMTSHYEFHDIHDNVLKLDILGHIDPTAMKFLEDISGIDVRKIPMNDEPTLSLFTTTKALKLDERKSLDKNGAAGLPEFGTPFVRRMLDIAQPKTFSDLVQVTGLAHGTNVWANNAQELITKDGLSLQDVIGCRDDIMTEMIAKGLDPKLSFQIMEDVRKGRKLSTTMISEMKKHQVPDWYIESCDVIQYLFPKAHAVAYCMMGFRVAWFKVHHPLAYYAQYFSLRAEAFELNTMLKGVDAMIHRIEDISSRLNIYNEHRATTKERNILATLEVAVEMYLRGYSFSNFDVRTAPATQFSLDPQDDMALLIPFNAIDGLGSGVALSIVEAREHHEFISIEDIASRSQITQTSLEAIRMLGGLAGLQESNQISLF